MNSWLRVAGKIWKNLESRNESRKSDKKLAIHKLQYFKNEKF